jgi:hypothetical protein
MSDWDEIHVPGLEAAIESNPGLVKGVKLRLVENLIASKGLKW